MCTILINAFFLIRVATSAERYCDGEQTRSGKHRVCIWLEVDDGDNYFVVLDVRKTFVLLWTAFYADYPHQVRKKAKEYEEWLRLSGRVLTPDELIKNIMQRIND